MAATPHCVEGKVFSKIIWNSLYGILINFAPLIYSVSYLNFKNLWMSFILCIMILFGSFSACIILALALAHFQLASVSLNLTLFE